MKRMLSILLILLSVAILPAYAEEAAKKPEPAPAVADTPAETTSRTTPIFISQKGADVLGSILAYEVTSACNSSSLFKLTTDDQPNISVMITTLAEFSSRPEIGSVYSIVWVFSENNSNLKYFLAQDAGIITKENTPMLAKTIAAKTDQLAMQYGYLFE